MKQEQKQKPAPTFESVWALMEKQAQERAKEAQERKKASAKFDRALKKSSERFDREMAKSRAEFDQRMKEAEKLSMASKAEFDQRKREADERIKKLEELVGSQASNHGSFAEEYFFNSFENGKQNFFGEKFDYIEKNLFCRWQDLKDEYDIVLYNHTSVALIEVKYKAHKNDIPKVLKKAETFRILSPYYKEFKIYLGLASMSFYPDLEQKCVEQGIAVIKQVGDSVVINDKNLRVF